jgi:hypothetical protein
MVNAEILAGQIVGQALRLPTTTSAGDAPAFTNFRVSGFQNFSFLEE